MKRFLPLILALFSASVLRADICESVFKTSSNVERAFDIKNIDRINRLEGWSKRLRLLAYKEDPLAPSFARKGARLFERAEKGLLSGSSDEGVQAYKLLFRKVEGGSLIIEGYEGLAKALKTAKGVSDIENHLLASGVVESLAKEYGSLARKGELLQLEKKVQKILRKRYRKLGRDFASYNHAQQSLQRLRSAEYCSPQCQQAIEELYANTGLRADADMFGTLRGVKKHFTIDEVRKLFNSHPSAVLAARKKEFFQEGVAVLKKYVGKFKALEKVINRLAQSRWAKNKRVIRIFKGTFDARFYEVDQHRIHRVSKSKFSPKEKLALAQEQSGDIDQNLFFMNFSRSTDGDVQKAWTEIKKAAEQNDSGLYQRMLSAQELGQRLGPPSKRKLTRVFQILAGVGIAGAGWAYFNFDMEEDEMDPSSSEGDRVNYQLDQIDLEQLENEEESDETEILIEYLGKDDAQVTDSFGALLEMETELGKDSAPISKD